MEEGKGRAGQVRKEAGEGRGWGWKWQGQWQGREEAGERKGREALKDFRLVPFFLYRIGPRCRVWAKILHHRSSPQD